MKSLRPKDKWDLIARTIAVIVGISIIGFLAYSAILHHIDGVALASSVGAIVGIVLAYLGVKARDVLFR